MGTPSLAEIAAALAASPAAAPPLTHGNSNQRMDGAILPPVSPILTPLKENRATAAGRDVHGVRSLPLDEQQLQSIGNSRAATAIPRGLKHPAGPVARPRTSRGRNHDEHHVIDSRPPWVSGVVVGGSGGDLGGDASSVADGRANEADSTLTSAWGGVRGSQGRLEGVGQPQSESRRGPLLPLSAERAVAAEKPYLENGGDGDGGTPFLIYAGSAEVSRPGPGIPSVLVIPPAPSCSNTSVTTAPAPSILGHSTGNNTPTAGQTLSTAPAMGNAEISLNCALLPPHSHPLTVSPTASQTVSASAASSNMAAVSAQRSVLRALRAPHPVIASLLSSRLRIAQAAGELWGSRDTLAAVRLFTTAARRHPQLDSTSGDGVGDPALFLDFLKRSSASPAALGAEVCTAVVECAVELMRAREFQFQLGDTTRCRPHGSSSFSVDTSHLASRDPAVESALEGRFDLMAPIVAWLEALLFSLQAVDPPSPLLLLRSRESGGSAPLLAALDGVAETLTVALEREYSAAAAAAASSPSASLGPSRATVAAHAARWVLAYGDWRAQEDD